MKKLKTQPKTTEKPETLSMGLEEQLSELKRYKKKINFRITEIESILQIKS